MSELGPLVVLCGLTATVHGPYTPLGIRKHTVYLVGFDLGAQMFAHLDRHTVQDTGVRTWLLTYQGSRSSVRGVGEETALAIAHLHGH